MSQYLQLKDFLGPSPAAQWNCLCFDNPEKVLYDFPQSGHWCLTPWRLFSERSSGQDVGGGDVVVDEFGLSEDWSMEEYGLNAKGIKG